MQLPTFALGLLQLSAAASASLLESRQFGGPSLPKEELMKVCVPGRNSDKQDRSAPCYRGPDIAYSCMAGGVQTMEELGKLPDTTKEAPLDVQQKCICDSEIWDLLKGCANCFKLHGGVENVDYTNDEYYDSISSDYCGGKPTIALNEIMASNTQNVEPGTTHSDVLGTQTAASLYYTAADATATGGPDSTASETGVPGVSGVKPTGTGAEPTQTGAASALGAGVLAPVAGAMMVMGMLG